METFVVNRPLTLRAALVHYLGLSASDAARMIKNGHVKVNGHRTKDSVLLSPGDQVDAFLPLALRPQLPEILYEDEAVLAVVKRPGIEVCDGDGMTLLELLHENGYPEAIAVHRLDVHTGGLLLFARSPRAEEALRELLSNRDLHKEYECVVTGLPEYPGRIHRAYLTKDARRGMVYISADPRPGAKEIRTQYDIITVCEGYARLRVQLITGRTHQIRAHLAFMGHPILGDDRYGSRQINAQVGLKRPLLWAAKLTFPKELPPILASLSGRVFTSEPQFSAKSPL